MHLDLMIINCNIYPIAYKEIRSDTMNEVLAFLVPFMILIYKVHRAGKTNHTHGITLKGLTSQPVD